MPKSFDGYELGSICFPFVLGCGEFLNRRFIDEKKYFILCSSVEIGETHLAIAPGMKICSMGTNDPLTAIPDKIAWNGIIAEKR